MIPDEAVEAAAEAIAAGLRTNSIADLARLALEAAAPYLQEHEAENYRSQA